jgi:hypothetical protein
VKGVDQISAVRYECMDQQPLDIEESSRDLNFWSFIGEWSLRSPEVLKSSEPSIVRGIGGNRSESSEDRTSKYLQEGE